MNADDRDNLVRKLRMVWPEGGPSNMAWADVFDGLEAGTAGTALLRLRNEHDKCPTIARFVGQYRELQTRARNPIPGDESECRIGRCDGSGWLPAKFTVPGRGGRITDDGEIVPHEYTGVYPCDCPAGSQLVGLWRDMGGTYADKADGPSQGVLIDD